MMYIYCTIYSNLLLSLSVVVFENTIVKFLILPFNVKNFIFNVFPIYNTLYIIIIYI